MISANIELHAEVCNVHLKALPNVDESGIDNALSLDGMAQSLQKLMPLKEAHCWRQDCRGMSDYG